MESTIDDVVKSVERFRILCVGKSGVGKSSLINRVFGLQEAPVAHWTVGPANIEIEHTSDENKFVVVHNSMGLEPGNANTFNIAHKFITERRDKTRPLKDQLHVLWLCTETPVAGGRLETGDEKLLQLAQQTDTPVVVVFTKYDKLIRTKMYELRNDEPGLSSDDLDKRAKEEAQKALDTSVQSLHNAIRKMDAKMRLPRWAKVSINEGYEADISSLREITGDVIQEMSRFRVKDDVDVLLLWKMAQLPDLRLKIDACATISTFYYRRSLDGGAPGGAMTPSLRDYLEEVHEGIITCWNFKDQTILNVNHFKRLMLYLVQDVRESLNRGGSSYTCSSAIGEVSQFLSQITTKSTEPPAGLPDWLQHTVLQDEPRIHLFLMAYTVDLTTVLKLLFENTLSRIPQSSGITWSELKRAFDTYKDTGLLERIHHRIYDIFQHDQQILGSEDSFRRMFNELLETKRQASSSAPTPIASPKLAPVAKPSASRPSAPPSASPPPSAQRRSTPRLSALRWSTPRRSAPQPSAPAPPAPAPSAPRRSKPRPSTSKLSAGSTKLHYASRMGHVDDARRLIEGDEDATAARDEHGWTPLHHASSRGHSELVRLLLFYGTEAEAQDKDGSTPLHMAARGGHVQVSRILLGRDGTNPKLRNNNPLADACPRDERNMTPLHLASMFGRLEVVKLLLEIDKNPNLENEDRQTPLFLASRVGRVEVALLLLSWGADLNRLDCTKRSSLHVASENGHFDVAELLIKKGAHVNAKDVHLWTPLHAASKAGKVRVAEVLLRLGADVGAQNNFGRTPLHMASQEGHLELAQLLLDYRANVESLDGNDETALHLAAYYGSLEVTKLLLDNGAKRDVKNKSLKAPSDLASNESYTELVRLLTEGIHSEGS